MKTHGFRTFYEWMLNNPELPKKNKIFLKETKLFLIKTELFLNLHKKAKAKYNLNYFNPNLNTPQRILDFPFKKMFIEPSEEIEMGFKMGKVSFKGFLVEDDVFEDKIILTIYFSINGWVTSIPFEIDRFLRKDANGLISTNTGKSQYIDVLKQLGYDYGEEDIPINASIVNIDDWDKKANLDNREFWELSRFYSNLEVDFVNIIQFINSINSEIIYIGSTELDRKKRLSSGQIPIPESYSIYLHDKPIKKQGYLFDGTKFSQRYIYDIRGYRRHFRNKKVYQKIYTLYEEKRLPKEYSINENGTIYRWINPFRRGSGFYIKKQYNITKQEYHKL